MGDDGVMHAGTIATNNFWSHHNFCFVWGRVTISQAKSRALSSHCTLDSFRRHPLFGHQGDDRDASDLLARLPCFDKPGYLISAEEEREGIRGGRCVIVPIFFRYKSFAKYHSLGEQSYRSL